MSFKRVDFSKLLFFSTIIAFTLSLAFIYGLFVGFYKVFPLAIIMEIKDILVQVYEEKSISVLTTPRHWLNPLRYEGDGVTINESPEDYKDDAFILLQGFFGGSGIELRLIRRNGSVVARWPISYSTLATDLTHVKNAPASDWNVDSHGAVVLPDGSVVFNLDHIGLFKLDRCNNLVWMVDSPTHHSVERNSDGSFWVSSANNFYSDMELPYPLFKAPFAADKLMRVSPEGEILDDLSLIQIFEDSNQLALLTLTGGSTASPVEASRPDITRELFHLNDVEELPADIAGDFPMFTAGDILVSLRNRNLLIVIDGDTQRIKWWKIGPWVRQHDPDWKRGGTITVFDNNRDGTATGDVLGGSRIIEIDPATSQSWVIYGGQPGEFFYSEIRGKHQNLGGSRVLITESEAGRVFEINSKKQIIWQYVNRYSDTKSARITEARAYDSDYFSVKDWTCTQL